MNESTMPVGVARDLLDMMFGRKSAFAITSIALSLTAVFGYLETSDAVFLAFPGPLLLVFSVRAYLVTLYKRSGGTIMSRAEIKAWEIKYLLGGVASAATVGVLSFYATYYHLDAVTWGILNGIIMACLLIIVGKNFASLWHVALLMLNFLGPMMAAIAMHAFETGVWRHLIVAALPVFLMMLSLDMARYLRTLLLKSVRSAHEVAVANRTLNVAISSVPNGLVMVSHDGIVSAANDHPSTRMFGVREPGLSIWEAVEGSLDQRGVDTVVTTMLSSTLERGKSVEVRTVGGNWLRCHFRRSLIADDPRVDGPDQDDNCVVVSIEDITASVQTQEELQFRARFDALTKIANRQHWEEEVVRRVNALGAGEEVALCLFDIDRFKLINDTRGHHIGDLVIAGVADRLRSFKDDRIFAGRYGGDEFVVLVTGINADWQVRNIFENIFQTLCSTYLCEDQSVEVKCTGGVVLRTRGDFNLEADLGRADLALYKIKRKDIAWRMFDESLEGEYEHKSLIKHDLRAAIEGGELEVVYQPIYDVTGRKAVGSEALCRWTHPKLGRVPPAEFVALAEEMGLIGKLSEYVLRRACTDATTWDKDVGVSVNLSAIDLSREDLVGMIDKVLDEAKLAAPRLCIEVTEGVFMKDFAKTAETVRQLRERGVNVSLDDFGTGYWTLKQMHMLPLDRVKIDRSFISGIATDANAHRLFTVTVSLAHQLGYEVVVEGVETESELSSVVSIEGVDMIQGHIFSEAKTGVEMREQFSRRAA